MEFCLICKWPVPSGRVGNTLDRRYECPDCGTFDTQHLLETAWKAARAANDGKLQGEAQDLLPYLASATRRASVPIRLTTNTWMELARAEQSRPLSHKIAGLLETVANRTSAPGEWIRLPFRNTRPLLGIRDRTEFDFIKDHLVKVGYLEAAQMGVPGTEDGQGGFQQADTAFLLTVKGWEFARPMTGVIGTCFVAMAFADEMDDAFDQGIAPAVETDCGFRVLRVDHEEHNDQITDRIIAGIRSAQFVVADFTLNRGGVYYEAGFALGLGKTVIWTCNAAEEHVKELHFDTRQFNHILWSRPAELREALANRIRATIPNAKPMV